MNNNSPEKITVLLADDHLLMQQGIRSSLSRYPDMEIVGEEYNGIDAQYMVTTFQPRVVLLDLQMPELPPALFVKWAREFHPETAILVLTFHIHNVSCLAGMMQGRRRRIPQKKSSCRRPGRRHPQDGKWRNDF
jgi:DNA-binding NarL/FixJ family response regulator